MHGTPLQIQQLLRRLMLKARMMLKARLKFEFRTLKRMLLKSLPCPPLLSNMGKRSSSDLRQQNLCHQAKRSELHTLPRDDTIIS